MYSIKKNIFNKRILLFYCEKVPTYFSLQSSILKFPNHFVDFSEDILHTWFIQHYYQHYI